MKTLKYVLLVIGFLGLIASIYNMIYEGTISNQLGAFVSSLALIFIYFR